MSWWNFKSPCFPQTLPRLLWLQKNTMPVRNLNPLLFVRGRQVWRLFSSTVTCLMFSWSSSSGVACLEACNPSACSADDHCEPVHDRPRDWALDPILPQGWCSWPGSCFLQTWKLRNGSLWGTYLWFDPCRDPSLLYGLFFTHCAVSFELMIKFSAGFMQV